MRMKRQWLLLSLLVPSLAAAHDLECEVSINEQSTFVVREYPATLTFRQVVRNIHPTLPSTLQEATDPLLGPLGWSFTPPPPVTIPVNDSLTYEFSVTVESLEDCARVGQVPPSESVEFTDTLQIGWDQGMATCSARVQCVPADTFVCDDTLYVSSSAGTSTELLTLDPTTLATTPVSSTTEFGYDAMGLSHVDGYLYAISNRNLSGDPLPHVIRVDRVGNIEDLGSLPELAGQEWIVGTIMEDGSYVIGSFLGSHWLHLNPVTLEILGQGTLPTTTPTAWAANPLDNKIYGYQSYLARMSVFDPYTGDFTVFGPVLGNVGIQPCSCAFQQDGTFLLYCYTSDPTVDALFEVDLVNGVATLLGSTPSLAAGDMASCAFPPSQGATPAVRPSGYYMIHEAALERCLASGPVKLGLLPAVVTKEDALRLLWSSPAFTLGGERRSEEQAARHALARQTLTGVCNQRLFGGTPELQRLLLDTATTLGHTRTMSRLEKHLGAANGRGLDVALPYSLRGRATPSHALEQLQPRSSP